jgi:acyl-CoA thioesterase
MEDYQSAFLQRHSDTKVLLSSSRKMAAMHFGGITIECLLKSMILASLPKKASREWKTDSNQPGHTITNPGHSFQDALKRLNRLNSRIDKFPEVRTWIDAVENPGNQHFIGIRYSGHEPDDADYKQWLLAYRSLSGWLQKQATQL